MEPTRAARASPRACSTPLPEWRWTGHPKDDPAALIDREHRIAGERENVEGPEQLVFGRLNRHSRASNDAIAPLEMVRLTRRGLRGA